MARLIPILFMLAVGIALFVAILRAGRSTRSRQTYRPRPKWSGSGAGGGSAPGTVHVVHRRDIEGLRDAYSSAPLDAAQPLARCGSCQAFYQAPSVRALERENGGKCMICGSRDLGPVRFAD